MTTKTYINNSKIVLGELVSKTFLTDQIAFGFLNLIKTSAITPSARKSKEGWVATLEDESGNMLLFSTEFYNKQEQALKAAELSLTLLK